MQLQNGSKKDAPMKNSPVNKQSCDVTKHYSLITHCFIFQIETTQYD